MQAASGSATISPVARNATLTSLMVCCGFIVCWTPNGISFLLNFFGYTIDFAGWFYHFIYFVRTPIIYFLLRIDDLLTFDWYILLAK